MIMPTASNAAEVNQTVVIVGAVAAGINVAIELRKRSETLRIIVLEQSPYFAYSTCGLPYGLGESVEDETALFGPPEAVLEAYYNLDIRLAHQVTAIDAAQRTVTVEQVLPETLQSLQPDNRPVSTIAYDALVLATGSKASWPAIEGLEPKPGCHTLQTPQDYKTIKEYCESHAVETVAILGGGYIGIEVAEQLKGLGKTVHLLNREPRLMAKRLCTEIALPVQLDLVKQGVVLWNNTTLTQVNCNEEGQFQLRLEQAHPENTAQLAETYSLDCQLIIVAIGGKPNNKLAKAAGLALQEPYQTIAVDEYLQTSDSAIWALGDVVAKPDWLNQEPRPIALADYAHRQAIITASAILHAFQLEPPLTETGAQPYPVPPSSPALEQSYHACVPSSILQVFDKTLAEAGYNQSDLVDCGQHCDSVLVHGLSNSSYLGNAKGFSLKLIYRVPDGILLGAQIYGAKGSDKRIDVISTAIKAGWTVFDLAQVDLAYSPPYASPKDPIHVAANKAVYLLQGWGQHLQPGTLFRENAIAAEPQRTALIMGEAKLQVIDLRAEKAFTHGALPGAENIPFKTLRKRLEQDELSTYQREEPILLYDDTDEKAHFAATIMRHAGFKRLYSLEGGYRTWEHYVTALKHSLPPIKNSSSPRCSCCFLQ